MILYILYQDCGDQFKCIKGWISVTVHDLHLVAFPDKTKAAGSQECGEKVDQMKKKW